MLRSIYRLLRYRPGLFALNCMAWGIFHSLPLAIGLIMREIFNALSGGTDAGLSPWTLIALLVATAAGRMLDFRLGVRSWTTLLYTLECLLRRNMLEWLVQGPGARSLPDAPGETISRFRDDVEDTLQFVESCTDFTGFALYAVIALIIMAGINPIITLVVFLPLVGISVTTYRLGGRIRKYRKANREATGRVTAFIGEMFGAVQAVKVASAERDVLGHFEHLNEIRREAALKDTLFREMLRSVNGNMVNVGTGIVLLLAAGSMHDGGFSVGDFALFAVYLQRITHSMYFFGSMLAEYRRASVSVDRMRGLLKDAPEGTLTEHAPIYSHGEIPDVPRITRGTRHRLTALEVVDLSYAHPGTGRGIESVNFRIRKGSFTVITGRIGSGKTTLLRVLLGLLPRDSGEIRWNSRPVTDPASFLIPPRIAYTSQVPRLFSDSLRENVAMGQPIDEPTLQTAMRLAVMESDLQRLDDGLETMVGPRGVKLSGGQMQRTAAARMFVHSPELLIFDDLSSALDVETERQLWEQIFERRDETCLVVSHRRPALQRADHIIVLKDGKIESEGTLAELLVTSEEMQRLWHGDLEEDRTMTA